MKVLLVAHRFPPDDLGGVERHVETVARGLREAGHDVRVLALREGARGLDATLRAEEHVDGTPVTRLVTGPRSHDRHLYGAAESRLLLERVLVEERPDVVHVHQVLFLDPRLPDTARRLGAAVVVTLHDYYFACPLLHLRQADGSDCDGPRGGLECASACFAPEGPGAVARWTLRASYYRRLLETADLVLAPSHYVADRMEELMALPVAPLSHGLQRPADPRERYATPDERGRLVLAVCGTIVPHKGIDVLVGALIELGPAFGPVELRIAGAVGSHVYADHLRDALGGMDWVDARFLGPYAPDDLDWILEDVDALVVPSVWAETFSLVAREALLRGVPAIVSDRGAPSEAIVDGENGLVVSTDGIAGVVDALRRLRREPDLLPRLRAGARATQVPTVEDHVAGLTAQYAEALRRRSAAPVPSSAQADELDALEAAQVALGFAAG